MRRAVMAEGNVAPGKKVVCNCLFGAPTPKPPDGLGGVPPMRPGRSPTAPKGVPSEANPELFFGEVAEKVGIDTRLAKEEAVVGGAVGVHCDELLPGAAVGFAQVGEAHSFVWWAPDGLGREVEVAALEEVELAGAQHEVEADVRSGVKIGVNGGEDGEIGRVEPQLPNDGRCGGFDATRDGAADVEVEGWQKVKALSPGER